MSWTTIDRHHRGGKLSRGKETQYIGHGVSIDISGYVFLGERVTLSDGVLILTHEHDYRDHSLVDVHDLNIQDDVFIGIRAIITAGCNTIGKGAYIGAGTVVNCDVPPYAVVKGNPAIIVKYLK